VKRMRPQLGGVPGYLERFKREAIAGARISHRGIAGVYDYGFWKKSPFLVMEFIDGDNLSDLLRSHGPFKEAEALAYVGAALDALACALKMGVIHRDIKPVNLMLDKSGTMKVLDFGLARVGGQGLKKVTVPGQTHGTPGYMSPEQALGQDVDFRADIYAAGVTIFELTTGRNPFGSGSVKEILKRQLTNSPPPDPRAIVPGLGPGLSKLLKSMMAWDPDDRFESYPSVIQEIDKLRGA